MVHFSSRGRGPLAGAASAVFNLFMSGENIAGGRRRAWLVLAYPCWGLALLGVVVPLLPATPFALLALYAGARGSARFNGRVLAHPLLGPAVRDWQQHRVVGRRPKQAAAATMAVSSAVLFATTPNRWLAIGVTAFMASVGVWLWLRPEAPPPLTVPVAEGEGLPPARRR